MNPRPPLPVLVDLAARQYVSARYPRFPHDTVPPADTHQQPSISETVDSRIDYSRNGSGGGGTMKM